jgi:hypothetical protein
VTELTELHDESCDSVDSALELLSERMIKQYGPRLILVVLESSVEEVLEGGGLTHVRNGRNMDKEPVATGEKAKANGSLKWWW